MPTPEIPDKLFFKIGEVCEIAGIEPYGMDVDPVDGSSWVSDLRSGRVLHVDRAGRTVRVSPPLQTPYAVRVSLP